MSKSSIPLHPKYGLNPTIPLCFYCGKSKNEIAMLGAKYKGEAPKHMVVDIEPCEECKNKYADYTLMVETNDRESDTDRKRGKHPQPTGRWCALHKDCLNTEHSSPIAFVEPETMNFLLSKKASEDN